MPPLNDQIIPSNEEEEHFPYAIQFAASCISNSVLNAAIELELFDIIAKFGNGTQISSSEIATHLPTKNPNAPSIIDRMLCLLASYNLLTCSLVTDSDGRTQRLYGLAPAGKYFARDEDGVSIAPLAQFARSRGLQDIWCHSREFVLEGGSASQRAHGAEFFEKAMDNHVFDHAMNNLSTIILKRVLEKYNGFHGITELVDVGGGFGASLKLIVSRYPHIKGINFDLPHVIKKATQFPGIKHVEGDMFQQVPKTEVIFLKAILHDWDDEHCLKLLKNCYEALPESGGKVIVLDSIWPEYPHSDSKTKAIFISDANMLVTNPGAGERTMKQFDALAKMSGFEATALVCEVYSYCIIEFYKNPSNRQC